MRREGFEMTVSRPRVLIRTENGARLEPIEEVTIDVDEEYSSTVVDALNKRKACDARHARRRRRQNAACFSCAIAWPYWLSQPVFDGHARHGRFEPRFPQLWPLLR